MSEPLPVMSPTADAVNEAVALRLAALSVAESASLRLAALPSDDTPLPADDTALPTDDTPLWTDDACALRLAALDGAPRPLPPIAWPESTETGSFVARAMWTVSRTELEWRVPESRTELDPHVPDAPVPRLVDLSAPTPLSPARQIASPTVQAPRALPARVERQATRGRGVVRFIAAAIVLITTLVAPSPRETTHDALSVMAVDAPLAPASFAVPPLESYKAEFATESPFPTVRAGDEVEWVIALRNTGSAGWYRGVDGAQASLAVLDGTLAAVQTTPFVGPGQLGWFVTRFKAPATPSTYTVRLVPNIDGRGLLPDLGIYTVVTVTR